MIDYKDAVQLRELMQKVTRGPWGVDTAYSTEPGWEHHIDSQLVYKEYPADTDEDDSDEDTGVVHHVIARINWRNPVAANTQFIALAREALPYWIERAEAAERAVERLLDALDHGARCPQAGMWDECRDYGDAKCRACRKAWAMKE